MKKIALIVLCMGSLLAANAQRNTGAAGAYEGPKFVIKTNPLPMLGGQIPLTNEYRLVFEMKTGAKQSVQLYGSYMGKSPFLSLVERYSYELDDNFRLGVSGFRVQAMYKFYLLNKSEAPEGLYVGPNISFATAKMWDKNYTPDYVHAYYTSGSIIGGYQLIAGHFAFDVYAGLGLKRNVYKVNLQDASDFPIDRLGWWGPKFTFGFNLGYAW